MTKIPYVLVVGSLTYAMLCNRLNICHTIGMESRDLFNLRIKILNSDKEYILIPPENKESYVPSHILFR